MIRSLLFAILIGFVFSTAWPADTTTAKNNQTMPAYVCPMHPDQTSDKPGNCPVCGMAMVKADKRKVEKQWTAAILLFEGVQIIDFTAPYEILGQAHMKVFTVSKTGQPLNTSMNLRVTATYSFANAPAPDVIVVPGGEVDSAVNDPDVVSWVRNQSKNATYVMSVCNGAFILAKAGLLDGLRATTFHGMISDLRRAAPKTTVLIDQRFVDNGKIITSAGLSSGIDTTLHLVSKIYGNAAARSLALHEEYDWHPDSNFARANMPDRFLPDLNLSEHDFANWNRESSLGDMNQWEYRGTFDSNLTPEQLLGKISELLARNASNWKPVASHAKVLNTSFWKISDENGRPWTASVAIAPHSGNSGAYSLIVKIQKSKS
jgi:putative intracellular protease/amidase